MANTVYGTCNRKHIIKYFCLMYLKSEKMKFIKDNRIAKLN